MNMEQNNKSFWGEDGAWGCFVNLLMISIVVALAVLFLNKCGDKITKKHMPKEKNLPSMPTSTPSKTPIRLVP